MEINGIRSSSVAIDLRGIVDLLIYFFFFV
jgi:hypothetical protein